MAATAGGEIALYDRSSTPVRYRDRTISERDAQIERLRRQRLTGDRIARRLGLPRSTVGAVLRRLGLGHLKRLDPPLPAVRYQRERPGELLHLDTKKLGRIEGIGHRITGRRPGAINRHHGIGWEALHVAIDDASRLAYTGTPCRTRRKKAPLPSSAVHSTGSPATASRRARHDRQRLRLSKP